MKMHQLGFALALSAFISLFGYSSALKAADPKTICSLDFSADGPIAVQKSTDVTLIGDGTLGCREQGKTGGVNKQVHVMLTTSTVFPRMVFAPHVSSTGRIKSVEVRTSQDLVSTFLVLAVSGSKPQVLTVAEENTGLTFDVEFDDAEGFGIAPGATTFTIY